MSGGGPSARAPLPGELVFLGSVAKPHSIRGELAVDCLDVDPALLAARPPLYLKQGAGPHRPVRLVSAREQQGKIPGRFLVRLAEVTDRNAAEALRGAELYIPVSQLPALDEDELYLHELEGLAILLPDGSRLGVLAELLLPTEETEVWVIATDEGKEVLFPATEQFVTEVDLEAGTATIAPPEGLLELYLSDLPEEPPNEPGSDAPKDEA